MGKEEQDEKAERKKLKKQKKLLEKQRKEDKIRLEAELEEMKVFAKEAENDYNKAFASFNTAKEDVQNVKQEVKDNIVKMNQLEDQNEDNVDEVVEDENENENNNQGAKSVKKTFLTPAQKRMKDMKDKAKFSA